MSTKKICALLLACLMVLISVPQTGFAFNDAERVYLYVAVDGDDSAAGTADAPLASIIGARDKIRELRAGGQEPVKGFVVYLRGGEYNLTEAVKFEEQDGGKEGAPVVYRSYPGETVTLVGGVSVDSSKLEQVTNKDILDRLADQSVRDKLYSVNLKQMGFTNIGEPYKEGSYSYSAPLPTAKPSRSPELFVDGALQSVARYPNVGYMDITSVAEMGMQRLGIPGAPDTGDPSKGFTIGIKDERLKKWATAESGTALLQGYWYYDWADASTPLKSVDTANNQLTSTLPHVYGVKVGGRFFIYNLLEEIDLPGEYFIDRSNGVLYIYPPKNVEEIKSLSISLLDDDMITVNGASYLDIKGIDMMVSRKSAVVINSGNNVRIMDSDISYTAATAINIWDKARDCGVLHCHIHDVNGGILVRGGVYDTLEEGRNYAENNHIERFSRLTKTYTGAVTLGAVGNIARYNEMHDGPHLAVQFYGQNNKLEYNEIYDVIKEADDSGAIYGGQSWVGRGLQMRYNYVHDLTSDSGQSVGRAGIYLDGGQCDVTMMGNVMENIDGSAFWINGGQDNNVFNNITVNCQEAVYLTDIMATGIIPLETMLERIETYPWNDPASQPWKNEAWTTAYPEMLPMLENDPLLPLNNIMYNNLIVGGKATKFLGSAGQYLDMGENYVTNADPGFVDMENRNYLLKEDVKLPAELGEFQKLPFTRMGRYDSRARQRVKNAVVLTVNSPAALKEGKECFIDADNYTVSPKIIEDSTFVPLRFLSEGFGAEVSYDGATRGVRIVHEGNTLELTIDSLDAKMNGEAITLDKAPIIKGDRTIVPLRNITELLGKHVFWDDRGLIVVSDEEALFSEASDKEIISYLHELTSIY